MMGACSHNISYTVFAEHNKVGSGVFAGAIPSVSRASYRHNLVQMKAHLIKNNCEFVKWELRRFLAAL